MNYFVRLFFCVLLLMLGGCTKSTIQQRHQVAECNMVCMQHFEFCQRHCTDNCPTCVWKSVNKAKANFSKYVRERQVEGKKVMRELNSYRDPLQCRKVTCSCMTDLMTCKQSCSGVIKKRLQVVPGCV